MMEIELNEDTRTSSAPIPPPSSPTNDTCANNPTNTDSTHTTNNNNTISKSILRKYFLCCSCKTRQNNNKRIKKNKGVQQLQLKIPNNATDNTTTMKGDVEDSTEKGVFKSADCIMNGEEMNNPSTSWGWFITFKDGEEKWDPDG